MMINRPLSLLCLLAACVAAFAQDAPVKTIKGCTMAPLPAVAAWVGATLTVNEKEQRISLTREKSSMRLTFNSTLAVMNGKTLTIEAPPAIDNGIVYVPVSFISKAFGAKATWDEGHTKLTFTHPKIVEPLEFTADLKPETTPGPALKPKDPLQAAIYAGDLEKVKQLLAEDPKRLNQPFEGMDGETPLIHAVEMEKMEIIKFLIDKGADVKATFSEEKLSVLHMAAMTMDKEIVAFLVNKGLDVNTASRSGFMPLHLACVPLEIKGRNNDDQRKAQLDLIEWLLEHGAKVDAVATLSAMFGDQVKDLDIFPDAGTPMLFAALGENKDVENLLLKHGAKPAEKEARDAILKFVKDQRDRANQPNCVSNLRQLALHCLMFAQKHDEKLPQAETVWKDLAAAKVPPQLLKCPMREDLDNGFGFNAALAGKSLGEIANPAETLLFADCKSKDNLIHSLDDIDATRHNGAFVAAFLDGHVELIKDVTKIKLK